MIVDAEGTGEDAKFVFNGINKPADVPDAPPVEVETRARGQRRRRDGLGLGPGPRWVAGPHGLPVAGQG